MTSNAFYRCGIVFSLQRSIITRSFWNQVLLHLLGRIELRTQFDLEKRMFISVGLSIQIEIEGISGRSESVVIGASQDNFLIITMPRRQFFNNTIGTFLTGNIVTIRYVLDGTVMGFKSQILKIITDPGELIFLEYPKAVEELNLRTDKRVGCFLPSRLKIKASEVVGRIIDISKSGCQYSTKENDIREKISLLDKDNKQVELIIEFPGKEEEQVLKGNIRRINEDGNGIRIGIAFDNPEDKDEERDKVLESFLKY